MLVRCLQVADEQCRVAGRGYGSRLIRVEGLLNVAERHWHVLHVEAEEDGEQNPPHMLVYECGHVTQAGCMNVVTVKQVREGIDPVRGSMNGESGVLRTQSFSKPMRAEKCDVDLL
jgi:hypothetical protein